jgi:hypothetical protein
MKKVIFTLLLFAGFICTNYSVFAKVWRVNNNAGVNANFTDFPAAVTGSSAGDTIYLESSATAYSGGAVAKKLVIVGSGYYLTGTPINPNTQWNTNPSTIAGLEFTSGSAGSVLEGLVLNSTVYLGDDNITIQRNNFATNTSSIYLGYISHSNNDTIRQNVLYEILAYSASNAATNLFVYNNIIIYGISFTTNIANVNGYILNNDIGSVTYGGSTLAVSNFDMQNNILYIPTFGSSNIYVGTNTYFNNIVSTSSAVSGIPNNNGNVFSVTPFTIVYVDWNNANSGLYTPDGAYALAAGSPAIGAGSLNGVTVDCGVFGGPAPYVLSGMPQQIPSIYSLTAPTQVNSGTASINVTISAASH